MPKDLLYKIPLRSLKNLNINLRPLYIQQFIQIRYIMVGDSHLTTRLHISASIYIRVYDTRAADARVVDTRATIFKNTDTRAAKREWHT